MKPTQAGQVDPLYVIFEQHLCNFQDSDIDRKAFIGKVIQDYLTYLRKLNIAVPKSLEPQVVEELGSQVNVMLVKKIYGALTIQDYQKGVSPAVRKRVKAQYAKVVGRAK